MNYKEFNGAASLELLRDFDVTRILREETKRYGKAAVRNLFVGFKDSWQEKIYGNGLFD